MGFWLGAMRGANRSHELATKSERDKLSYRANQSAGKARMARSICIHFKVLRASQEAPHKRNVSVLI